MRKRLASLGSAVRSIDGARVARAGTTLLDLAGYVLVSGAAWMVYHPAGVAVSGCCVLYVSGSLAGAPPLSLARKRDEDDA